jgi:hypothetical protein
MDPMAKAINQYTTTEDGWPVDDTFRYLTRVIIGNHEDRAIYELTESLLAGRLRMSVRHVVDGALKSKGIVPAIFWRGDLVLRITKEGRAEVMPLKSLDPGEYEYTLSARDIRMLWPAQDAKEDAKAPVHCKSVNEWLADEIKHSCDTNSLPTGRGALTKYTQGLAIRMFEAAKVGEVVHAVGPRRLEAVIRETKLWPK